MNLQLFASHTVDVDLMPDEPVVLDVGCRWFDFTDQVLERWRSARVIAMDPARDVATSCHSSFIEYIQCGLVGSGPTFQRFAHFSTGEGDFITTAEKFHDAEMYEVPTMKIKDVMQLRDVQHFDLVKLDCEGSEYGILQALACRARALERVERIFVEWHGISPENPGKLMNHIMQAYEMLGHPLEDWMF